MPSIRPSRSVGALAVMGLPFVAMTFASAQWARAQPSAGADAVDAPVAAQPAASLDVARYNADGALVFPDRADRWIPVGASLGADYNAPTFDPDRPGPIGVVQMEPAAYDYFRANGSYADGTMLLLTFYAVQQDPQPALNGFVQGNVLQREIHVIDRARFADEGRAFFVFPDTNAKTAAPIPTGSRCVECHTTHGGFDGTFLQFYPALR